jgi:ATP-dependent Lhr-like helicase
MSDLVPQPSPLSTTSAIAQAFDRLAPGVQRQLWRMGWSHLRPLQVQAIHALLDHEAPVLLSAATAAGKTEAAFLPILSARYQRFTWLRPVLYVGPLRALINDQFSRLEELCEHLDIPVHRWHGDVGAAAKKKLIERPGGVLLLTPESLESLFINRSPHLSALFRGLHFVVIDELHAFLGTARGRHLQSLLARLEGVCEIPPRRVGLSATLGKDEGANESTVAVPVPCPW